MRNLVCKDCKSTDVTKYTPGIFGDSRHRCNSCGKISFTEDFVEPTIFDRITASPEVLAPYLVSNDERGFHSAITNEGDNEYTWAYDTEAEEIVATVEKLREV